MIDVYHFFSSCNALMGGRTPSAIVQDALTLLSTPDHWVVHSRAVDAQGARVNPASTRAVRWDITGAVAKHCNEFGIFPPYFALLLDQSAREFCPRYGSFGVDELSDVYGYECATGVLQKALETARAHETQPKECHGA